ncbi:hypothetical protein ACFC4G_00655, partial [Streptomyces sp. NPDC056002]|uniref:hypothetical protein n=1 Tax=Streptomyces sp. NPDC056002 TaxID=3345675 RepID=UPI0035D5FD90
MGLVVPRRRAGLTRERRRPDEGPRNGPTKGCTHPAPGWMGASFGTVDQQAEQVLDEDDEVPIEPLEA